jgi:hypothetical protein
MRRPHVAAAALSLAPWVVAGSLFLGEAAPVPAQDATPAPIEISAEKIEASADSPTQSSAGGESEASAVPSAGVGSGLATGGSGSFSLGAMVGAGVAALFALRERLRQG